MKKIKLLYFSEFQNFGDNLNLYILERLFNIKAERSSAKKADLVAIGSMLEEFLWRGANNCKLIFNKYLKYRPILIYGTGFIAEPNYRIKRENNLPETSFRRLNPVALRGTFTKQRVEKINNTSYPDLPLGDPGLISSYLIDKEVICKKYSLGIIPHYLDKNNPKIKELANIVNHSKIIDVQDNPIKVLEQIAQCETIISTAMHGLIASDALGIPNKWVAVSDKIYGSNYKFADYYSVFGIKRPEAWDLNKVQLGYIQPQRIMEEYKVNYSDVKIIQKRLVESFPYKEYA